MTAGDAISIVEVQGRSNRAAWLQVPYRVYEGDPAWIAPLLFQEKLRISPKHSPFFTFADVALFVALRNGIPVGRISAQINHRYDAQYGPGTGHFGFFESIDDQAVTDRLVTTASQWLTARGAKRMVGPFSFSINEECGLLVEGFDTPAAVLMNHARPYMGGLLEQAGFTKAMDLFAYRMMGKTIPEKIARLADHARRTTGITIRQIDRKALDEEIHTVIDIFNDAWSTNWGFVPFSDAEIASLIREIRPLYRSQYGRIAMIDGEPAAMVLGLPDINGMTAGFGGRLLPFNWARLVTTLMRQSMRSARIPLFGLRKKYQGSLNAVGLLALLISDFLDESRNYDFDWVEFSWVLETNKPMNAINAMAAGPAVKRYRIFERSIG